MNKVCFYRSLPPDRPALPLALRHEGAGITSAGRTVCSSSERASSGRCRTQGWSGRRSAERSRATASAAGGAGIVSISAPPCLTASRPDGAVPPGAHGRARPPVWLLQRPAAGAGRPSSPVPSRFSPSSAAPVGAGPAPRRRFPPRFLRRCCSGRPPSG